MAHTFEELRVKTVAQLREIAAELGDEAVKGYSQLNKEHLLAAICKALNIDMHVHHHAEGINKAELKSQIRKLKKERDEALAAHDHEKLKSVRRQIHQLNRRIKRATV
jgi:protein-arginine kinase activator protein McsA